MRQWKCDYYCGIFVLCYGKISVDIWVYASFSFLYSVISIFVLICIVRRGIIWGILFSIFCSLVGLITVFRLFRLFCLYIYLLGYPCFLLF